MKIIKENLIEENLDEVACAILNGKIVVFPTDTVYGIGTNAYDEKACEKIYEVKGRPKYKPLIVLINNYEMLDSLVQGINEIEKKLMDSFWPGPLTIILKRNKSCYIPDIVTNGDSIAVRMPNHNLTQLLIEKANVPIVAPSANLSGSVTGTKIKNIVNELGDKVDYILDCGDIENDTVSTIVQVENEKVIVIREGKITREQLQKVAEVI